MSVAFRRDGDEEHLEPSFELPIPPGPNLVTPRGLAQIEAKVAECEAALAAGADEEAIKAARRQARYWRIRLASAQLVPPGNGESVSFGCTVLLAMQGRRRSITIVGDDEAEPAAGLLAFSAPLVRAIMGAQVGERVDFAGKSEAVEILAIAPTGG